MSNYIKEVFRLKNKPYRKLIKDLTEAEILSQRRHFIVGDKGLLMPVTVWRLFYYIDKYGDFTKKHKLKHHKIANAIYDSLSSRRKLEVMEYIDDAS